jgi:hypothetical protein
MQVLQRPVRDDASAVSPVSNAQKKSGWNIVLDVPSRPADVSPPAKCFLATRSKRFLTLRRSFCYPANPFACEKGQSMPFSSLVEDTIATFG